MSTTQSLLGGSACTDYHRRLEHFFDPMTQKLRPELFGTTRDARSSLWPSPPPFVLDGAPLPSSRRRARWGRERAARSWVNRIFSMFSWLAVGSPPAGCGRLPEPGPLSPLQQELANSILISVRAFARRQPSIDPKRQRPRTLQRLGQSKFQKSRNRIQKIHCRS